MSSTIIEAVQQARQWLDKPDASVTYWRAPPIGYARVNVSEEERARMEAALQQQQPDAGEGQPCKYTLEKQRQQQQQEEQQQQSQQQQQ